MQSLLFLVLVVCALGKQTMQRPSRLIFSITTTQARIDLIKGVLDVLVEGQTKPPDAVYLALPLQTRLPGWLQEYNSTSKRPGVLYLLRLSKDYGPASKLLAVLREGAERSTETVVVFGDDDILYGDRIASLHLEAQAITHRPTAFGTRRISIGEGQQREEILEAVGTVSVRASFLPDAAFGIGSQPDACRLSDDYWISHHLATAGVELSMLPTCTYSFNSGQWPQSCGNFVPLSAVASIGALSSVTLARDGTARRGGGDWRDQLRRYTICQGMIEKRKRLAEKTEEVERRLERKRRHLLPWWRRKRAYKEEARR